LMDLNNQLAVLFVKGNSVNCVEQFFKIILDGIGVRALRKNLQQVSIWTEIETWEDRSLGFKIVFKLFLAFFKIDLHWAQTVFK
jgi:hypothetical protein